MSESKRELVKPEVANQFVERLQAKRAPQDKRLVPPKPAELGNQIVGSRHTYFVELPQTDDIASGEARASAILKPSQAMTATHAFTPSFALKPNEAAHQFEVEYAPTERGEHHGALNFIATWDDHHVEEMALPIHATARELDDVRNASVETAPVETVKPIASAGTAHAGSVPVTIEFDAAKTTMLTLLHGMFKAQERGIDLVKDEASTYKRKPAEIPFWVDLVQIALEVGLAVVSERLGQLVGAGASKILGKEFSEHHEAIVKSFEKMVDSGFENAVKKTKVLEVEAPERSESREQERDPAKDAGDDPNAAPSTTNPLLAFFDAQQTLLANSNTELEISMISGLAGLAGSFGPESPKVMEALSSIKPDPADRAGVKKAQEAATTEQWIKYLARADLGTDSSGAGVHTTTMDDVRRPTGTFGSGKTGDGLLVINAAQDGLGFRVLSARITGVASSTTDRLLNMELRHARIPIAIRINASTVTVDEAGRIRSDGPVRSRTDGIAWTEIQGDRDAEELVDAVLGKTLRAQRLRGIENDDVGTKK